MSGEPFHGYIYRMLNKQGASAKGGAYEYLVKDQLLGGFAAVAFPAEYGNSGVMTFIVNHDGAVYSKDLGAETSKLALAMDTFDPDQTWTKEEDGTDRRALRARRGTEVSAAGFSAALRVPCASA